MTTAKRWFLGVCGAALAGAALAADWETVPRKVFWPAFTAEAIDFNQCEQSVNGVAQAADEWRIRRTFGLIPAGGNWKDHIWTIDAAATSNETTYGFLVVLKQPVVVGTLSVSPADVAEPRGSVNGGELFYVTGDVDKVPDPSMEAEWTKVKFAAPAQHLRFCALPKGTTVKALYYKDVRRRGAAQVIYLNAYKQRLQDATALAGGSCEPKAGVKNPNALPQGATWAVEGLGGAVNAESPVSYTLTWNGKQKLDGVFFYSNADAFRFLAKSASGQWVPVDFTADWDNQHAWEGWHYNFRWLSLPAAIETSALKVEITAVDGKVPWITGLATMAMLGD